MYFYLKTIHYCYLNLKIYMKQVNILNPDIHRKSTANILVRILFLFLQYWDLNSGFTP
jgi:hypothetical protein